MVVIMQKEIIDLIISFYYLTDQFMEEANSFMEEYLAYTAETEYNMKYLQSLMIDLISRGVEDE